MKHREILLSTRLKEKRAELNLNQAEMAKRLGMKLRMYSLYETGKYDKSEGDVRRENLLLRIANLGKQAEPSEPQKGDQASIIQFLMDQIKVKDAENRNLYLQIESLNDVIAFFTGKSGVSKKQAPRHQPT